MIKIFLYAFVLVLAFKSHGQIDQIPDAFGAPLRSKSATIDGEIYYNSDWNRGDVEWQDGTVGKDLLLKYNTYSKKVELQRDGKAWEFTSKEIKNFNYSVNLYPDVKTIKFQTAHSFFAGEEGFVVVFFKDKIAAVEKIKAELISGGATYGSSESTTKIIQQPRLFIILPDGKAIPFKRTNGGLAKNFKHLKVAEFIKSHSLDVDNDEHFIEVLQYINNGY